MRHETVELRKHQQQLKMDECHYCHFEVIFYETKTYYKHEYTTIVQIIFGNLNFRYKVKPSTKIHM